MLICGVFTQPTSTQSEALDGIGRSFYETLNRNGLNAGASITGIVALVVFSVWWMMRERKRERAERDALEAQHAIAMSAPPSGLRDWVRVPAHLPLTLVQYAPGAKTTRESCETENVSAGGVAFHSHMPPPVGRSIDLTLDVGESRPLALRGVVVRVEPPNADESALVAVRLGPISAAQREHIAHWVAQEEVREVSETWKGRVCAVCKRPLESEASDVHATCTQARVKLAG